MLLYGIPTDRAIIRFDLRFTPFASSINGNRVFNLSKKYELRTSPPPNITIVVGATYKDCIRSQSTKCIRGFENIDSNKNVILYLYCSSPWLECP